MKHILLIALLLFALLPSKADWNLVTANNPNLIPANNPHLVHAKNPNHIPVNNPNIAPSKNLDNILTITPTVETVFYTVSHYIYDQQNPPRPAVRLKK